MCFRLRKGYSDMRRTDSKVVASILAISGVMQSFLLMAKPLQIPFPPIFIDTDLQAPSAAAATVHGKCDGKSND
jgi:hypothetical protein